jgi:probable phosphomutase (TIGR03848 family)
LAPWQADSFLLRDQMTRLFLIRHGRSTANVEGILAGHLPGVELDERGIEQAKTLAEKFNVPDLRAIISSPVRRCEQTAAFLADRLSMKVTADERFTEMDFGLWQGKSLADLATDPLWSAVQEHPSQVRFPDGESFEEVGKRASEAINHWNDLFETGSYVVFTHADVIKVAVAQAIGLPIDNFQKICVDPCSISIFDYAADRVTLRALNVQVDFADSMVLS